MAKKSFKGYVSSTPVEFDLESADGSRSLTVHCERSVPGYLLLNFLGNSSTEDPGSMAGVLDSLLKAAVLDEEWPAFEEFISAPANGIDLELLAEVAGYVAEMYGGRGNPQSPALSPAS